MMKEESGRTAVWDHAAETGMQDPIRRIAAVFHMATYPFFHED